MPGAVESSARETQDRPLTAAAHASLIAALLIAAGTSLGDHVQLFLSIPLTVAGFMFACLAAAHAGSRTALRSYRWIEIGLAMNAAVAMTVGPPSQSVRWYQIAYWTYFVAAVPIVGVVAGGTAAIRRRAIWIAILGAVALYAATPIATPRPTIDLWTLTDASVRGLLRGVHPYTVRAVDATAGAYDFGYVMTVVTYMPLVLLVNAPATAVLGDYRFGLALCLPATIALLRSAGRRLAVDDTLVNIVTLAFVLHPRGVYLVSLGWMEPWLLLALAAFVWSAARRVEGIGADITFMLLPALKQYVVAPAAIYVAMRRNPWRASAVGAAVMAATAGPFLLADWRATLDGMFFILRAPIAFREDSVSLVAFVARLTSWTPPRWLGPAAQLVVGAVAYVRLRHEGLAGVLLASALALCASFLAGMQAFVNYYAFVVGLLLSSALVCSREGVAAA